RPGPRPGGRRPQRGQGTDQGLPWRSRPASGAILMPVTAAVSDSDRGTAVSLPSRSDDDPRYTTSGAVYVPARDGLTTWFSGDVYTIKASRESTGGSLGLVEATVPPGRRPGSPRSYPDRRGVLHFLWRAGNPRRGAHVHGPHG